MPDLRIVGCETCGTEGRRYTMRRRPWQEPEEIDNGECRPCEGTGGEIIPVEPIEQEDLEMAYG